MCVCEGRGVQLAWQDGSTDRRTDGMKESLFVGQSTAVLELQTDLGAGRGCPFAGLSVNSCFSIRIGLLWEVVQVEMQQDLARRFF